MAIEKTTLHPQGNKEVDLYPKTSIDQVEGLNLALGNKLEKPIGENGVLILIQGTDIALLPYTALLQPNSFVFRASDGVVRGNTPFSTNDGDILVSIDYLLDKLSKYSTAKNLKDGVGIKTATLDNYNDAYQRGNTAFGQNNTAGRTIDEWIIYKQYVESEEQITDEIRDTYRTQYQEDINAACVWGLRNKVVGNNSSSGGRDNTVIGGNSHAYGYSNIITGSGALAQGGNNTIDATGGFARGLSNSVTGYYANALGYLLQAVNSYATWIGRKNLPKSDVDFGIGNGDVSKNYNHNSFEVYNNGVIKNYVGTDKSVEKLAFESTTDGRFKVHTAPRENDDTVRKQELDALRAELTAMINALQQ